MSNISSSYSPMSLQYKLLQSKTAIIDDKIRPVHIKLYPTDRCNAACSFCACKNLARDTELSTKELLEIIKHFHALGTQAITLGGGGEPSLHKGLPQLFELCKELDIHLGIITNGLIWSSKEQDILANDHLVWARMSIVDTESGKYDVERLKNFAKNLSNVDVSAYFVVTQNVNYETAMAAAEIVESLPNFTHLKFAEDTTYRAPEQMDEIERLTGNNAKVIFQRWKDVKHGQRDCLISKLRPVIGADAYVYPCCSIPQAKDYSLTMPIEFRMGKWSEFNIDTAIFDGTICKRCFWSDYNEVLSGLLSKLEHPRFI